MKAYVFYKPKQFSMNAIVNNPIAKGAVSAVVKFALSAVYGVDSHVYDYLVAWKN